MKTNEMVRRYEPLPNIIENFLKPWTDWSPFRDYDISPLTVPAVNVIEHEKSYELTLAAPGMDKKDFKIDLDGNVMTISSEKEEQHEEKNEKFSRKEYNYSSFCRSFTLPTVVTKDKIDAKYENGILKIRLPKNEDSIKTTISKTIEVK